MQFRDNHFYRLVLASTQLLAFSKHPTQSRFYVSKQAFSFLDCFATCLLDLVRSALDRFFSFLFDLSRFRFGFGQLFRSNNFAALQSLGCVLIEYRRAVGGWRGYPTSKPSSRYRIDGHERQNCQK